MLDSPLADDYVMFTTGQIKRTDCCCSWRFLFLEFLLCGRCNATTDSVRFSTERSGSLLMRMRQSGPGPPRIKEINPSVLIKTASWFLLVSCSLRSAHLIMCRLSEMAAIELPPIESSSFFFFGRRRVKGFLFFSRWSRRTKNGNRDRRTAGIILTIYISVLCRIWMVIPPVVVFLEKTWVVKWNDGRSSSCSPVR